MKYVRTEDRIINLERVVYGIKVIHLNENEIKSGNWAGWYLYNDRYYYELECRDADIIKQADTIEELCDEVVVINKTIEDYPYLFNKHLFKKDEKIGKTIKDYITLYTNTVIYGAIWTDKGLIYVAKMNEKGELELL